MEVGMSIDRLPASARVKLRRLEQLAGDARALTQARLHAIDNMRVELRNARDRRATTDPHDNAAMASAEGEVSVIEQRIEEAQRDVDRRSAAQRSTEQVLSQIADWLQRLPPNRVLQSAEAPKIKTSAANVSDQIEKARRRIIKLQSELQVVQAAPPTLDDLARAIDQHVAQLARDGKPQINLIGGLRVDWQMRALPHQFWAWVAAEVLANALLDQIGAVQGGMSDSERSTRTRKIKRDLLEIERQEEALIEFAQSNGVDATRRPLADARAILCVDVVKMKSAARAAA
jgi:hypothetical protein